ncbi:hypothetical protein DFH08DRAFT_692544 [Mycena albidolilacea]|uniref:Uncharacterized protein n=1 Tax=Mycena albidolilacea TaxID=1033008 RepID=A0AAD7ABN7_9AGAR|nr:hypothetical protein DFH08DRAFT_692544 [Mycena albidolilacea]
MFTLWVICVYFLWQQMRTGSRERNRCAFFLGYISVMCVFGTMYTVTTVHATTISYVQHRDFPGGPEAYNNFVLFSAPVGIASNVSYILTNWMADGLLLWRLVVLHHGSPYTKLIVTFPTLMYLGTIAMGIMLIIQTSHPFGSLWANGTINFALPYFVLSVSMTVIATGIMIARLLVARGRLQRLLGSSDNSEPYIGVAAMLVESCALYSTFSLIFIILFAVNNPIQYVFLSALANVQIIAPLLIIFRVSQGKAWTRNTEKYLHSTLEHSGQQQSNSRSITLSSLVFARREGSGFDKAIGDSSSTA